ncbi:MAG: SH3 domain-containing protein [Caldilineaceae bacterium]|nr:SH3 domain-containing protein [Caldilineaceae bacterium]
MFPNFRHSHAAVILVGIISILLAACGASARSDGPLAIRTPHPTFTPTPAAAQPQAAPQPATGGAAATPAPPGAAAAPATGAKAVVNSPLVNVRTGPSTDYEVVNTVERGAEYDIVGKNGDGSWWLICCVDGGEAWIIGEYVDTDGPVDSVPLAGQPAADASGTDAATDAATPPPAAENPAAPAPAEFTFDLRKQEQFPESGLVRIFLYVYAGNDSLAGYSLRISHNGADLPVEGTSFAGQPAFTWPFQDARQRYQNFKIEFSDVDPAGVWEVQLIDSAGTPVGPAATFTLAANDPQQELYVRYERR